jgi:hypothetical protein
LFCQFKLEVYKKCKEAVLDRTGKFAVLKTILELPISVEKWPEVVTEK